MRRHARYLAMVIALLCGVSVRTQVAQTPARGDGTFAGRWELTVKPPAAALLAVEATYAIVEIAGSDAAPTAKLIDSMMSASMPAKVTEISVKDGQLTLGLEM